MALKLPFPLPRAITVDDPPQDFCANLEYEIPDEDGVTPSYRMREMERRLKLMEDCCKLMEDCCAELRLKNKDLVNRITTIETNHFLSVINKNAGVLLFDQKHYNYTIHVAQCPGDGVIVVTSGSWGSGGHCRYGLVWQTPNGLPGSTAGSDSQPTLKATGGALMDYVCALPSVEQFIAIKGPVFHAGWNGYYMFAWFFPFI